MKIGIKKLVPFIGLLILGVNSYAVPASEVDWFWIEGEEPTFPNEAYGPLTDVDLSINSKGNQNIGDNQLFDVWVPDGPGPFPVYIYAHGGSFIGGSKRRIPFLGTLLQNDNVAFININYRLAEDGNPGQQDYANAMNDGIACLEYIRENAQNYKIDPDQLFVGGASAGGVIMNYIVYNEVVSGIKGVWQWNETSGQGVTIDQATLANVSIPVVNSHPEPYPSDLTHSALYAFNHASNNWSIGQTGMFLTAIKEDPSMFGYEDPYVNITQIWKDGSWIKDFRDGTDTGERVPNLGEWIYNVGGNMWMTNSVLAVDSTSLSLTLNDPDVSTNGTLDASIVLGASSNDVEIISTVANAGFSAVASGTTLSFSNANETITVTYDNSGGDLVDHGDGTNSTLTITWTADGSGITNTTDVVLDVTYSTGAQIAALLADITAGFTNVAVEVIEWPSELHNQLGEMDKLAFVTRPIQSSGKLPLIIYLHGGGPPWQVNSVEERLVISAEIDKKFGFNLAEIVNRDVMFLEPQIHEGWNPDTLDLMLDYLLSNWADDIDLDRVYVIGYSRGGGGTYDWLRESGDRFSAAAIGAFSSYRENHDLTLLENLPIWTMAGSDDNDSAQRATKVANMVDELRAAGNVNIEYTVIEGADHKVAGEVFFSSVEMVDWLLGFIGRNMWMTNSGFVVDSSSLSLTLNDPDVSTNGTLDASIVLGVLSNDVEIISTVANAGFSAVASGTTLSFSNANETITVTYDNSGGDLVDHGDSTNSTLTITWTADGSGITNTTDVALDVTYSSVSQSLSPELIIGWNVWTNSVNNEPASYTAGATGFADGNLNGVKIAPSSGSTDGTWGTLAVPPTVADPTDSFIRQTYNRPYEILFTVTATGNRTILDSFHFDAYYNRSNGQKDWTLSVESGTISTGVVATGTIANNLTWTDVDVPLTGLADRDLGIGGTAVFKLAWSGGTETTTAGHRTSTDNVGITARIPVDSADSEIELDVSSVGMVITWDSVSNLAYGVFWSSNLVDGIFQPLETNLYYPQDRYTDTVFNAESAGFYKLDVRQQ